MKEALVKHWPVVPAPVLLSCPVFGKVFWIRLLPLAHAAVC